MGDILQGSTTHKGNVSMLTPEQQKLYSSILEQAGGIGTDLLTQTLQPKGYEDYKGMFEEQYVKPAQQAYERQVVPGLQQRFVDVDAGASSAMNQALAQSAADLSTGLGSQFGQFMQNQQGQQQNALQQLIALITGQTFSPIIQERQGVAGPLIKAGGEFAAAKVAASSREVKENIKDYEKGIDDIRKMEVKQYDYKKELGGAKNKVGLIAEEVPEELTSMHNGILHVDLYGIMGLLLNAIKGLDKRMAKLEEAV